MDQAHQIPLLENLQWSPCVAQVRQQNLSELKESVIEEEKIALIFHMSLRAEKGI